MWLDEMRRGMAVQVTTDERAWHRAFVVVAGVLLAAFMPWTAQAQCGVTMSCVPPGGGGPVIDIGGSGTKSPCTGACILSEQGRRMYEQQNNCYFTDEYCGGTTAAHRIDRQTQCCGKDPRTGLSAVQDKQISQARQDFDWDRYTRSCPNMRQSEGAADALWAQCVVGRRHAAGDHWDVREVVGIPGKPNARPYCIDGCSTPPAAVSLLYRTGSFIFNDKDNPTGAGPGGFGEGSSFYGACAAHDRCYQTCNSTSRKTCDDTMLADMRAVCNRIPANHVTTFTNNLGFEDDENTRSKCHSAANRMHTGLRAGGGDAFNTRRQQYCQCC